MSAAYDLTVVGGGIHGCGVAQAAAAAGYSVLVLEQAALAHGTSSRSSKLIHGGLRYLEQFELGLVRECLRERRLLLRLAPSLVRLEPFHIPVYRDTSRRPWLVRAGLSLYSLLGGLHRHTRFVSLARARWSHLDGLDTNGLSAVFRYRDARTDDAALTRAVMASARALGAELACPARFTGARRSRDGVVVTCLQQGREREIAARVLVNAAGPWINRVLARVTPEVAPLAVTLVQGSHLLFDHRLTQGIYYVESPSDRRPVFVTPHARGTLAGTTEKAFHGDPGDAAPDEDERVYLLQAVSRYFPALAERPVLDAFAGVRVLPAGPVPANRRSRETVLHVDDPGATRVLSIYGGKLTSYRATAEKVVRRLAPSLPGRRRRARTDSLPLSAEADAGRETTVPGSRARETERGS